MVCNNFKLLHLFAKNDFVQQQLTKPFNSSNLEEATNSIAITAHSNGAVNLKNSWQASFTHQQQHHCAKIDCVCAQRQNFSFVICLLRTVYFIQETNVAFTESTSLTKGLFQLIHHCSKQIHC